MKLCNGDKSLDDVINCIHSLLSFLLLKFLRASDHKLSRVIKVLLMSCCFIVDEFTLDLCYFVCMVRFTPNYRTVTGFLFAHEKLEIPWTLRHADNNSRQDKWNFESETVFTYFIHILLLMKQFSFIKVNLPCSVRFPKLQTHYMLTNRFSRWLFLIIAQFESGTTCVIIPIALNMYDASVI